MTGYQIPLESMKLFDFGNWSSPDQSSNGSSNLDNFMEGINLFEGGKPGNRNVVNHNPGNLRAGPNMTGTAGGYATFGDVGDGWDALQTWVKSHSATHPEWDFYDTFAYYLRGSTTAPTSDAQGNSDAYADFVAQYMGVDPLTPVSSLWG